MKIILLDFEFYVLKYNFQLLCTQLKSNQLLISKINLTPKNGYIKRQNIPIWTVNKSIVF